MTKKKLCLRILMIGVVVLFHAVLFITVHLTNTATAEKVIRAEVFKLVDTKEIIELPPAPEKPPEDRVEIPPMDSPAEIIQETEKDVVIVEEAPPVPVPDAEPEYIAQHKVSKIPEMPTKQILKNIVYPEIPRRQGIESTVFLELYIDEKGLIRKIVVLKETHEGLGFSEAAIKALEGLAVRPAEANGVPVAVRYRYPVRFAINK